MDDKERKEHDKVLDEADKGISKTIQQLLKVRREIRFYRDRQKG